jgi:poly(hydroxyalkanoate) depolymerase family esterase
LPAALIKAFLPKPARKKRARRPATAMSAATKTVRAATRAAKVATPKVTATKAGRPKATAPTRTKATPTRTKATPTRTKAKPATRKPATRTPSGRRPPAPTLSSTGKGTWRQSRFTGVAGTRSYRVYIPVGLRRTTKAPMLLALHGCGQDGLDFAAGTRFNDLADKHKFVVVYPEQPMTHNGQRCWNWFRAAHQFRTQGEPAILAGIVRQVIQETTRWRIDPERVYVTGISAGGAMSVVLAATYPELFAAVGVHSAPPYRSATSPASALAAMQGRALQPPVEATATEAMPPMIVFHGTLDGTVRSVNAQRVADQWLAYYNHDARHRADTAPIGRPRTATTEPPRPTTARSRRGYRVSRWYAGGQKVLELWIVDGLGHAWSGGSKSGTYSDTRGPRASTEMWKFFSAHRSAAAAVIRVS